MQKTAFLFPGQGSQSVGMLSGLATETGLVEETFAEASDVLGYDLWQVTQNGPEEQLGRTEITQPALLAASIATWRVWKSIGGANPDYLAGHSLGEYSALVAAGSLAYPDAVALVAERGRKMQEATPAGSGAMAAILGLDNDVLATVCEQAAEGQVVSCANFNSPGQVVIAGEKDAVNRACALASEAGARRAIPLAVSAPSHCALMQPAAEAMTKTLTGIELAEGRIPVIHNVDVSEHGSADEIRRALVLQLSQPVRWSDTIEWLIKVGVAQFAECGPGKVLTGLNRRISRDVSTVALSDLETLEETKENWS